MVLTMPKDGGGLKVRGDVASLKLRKFNFCDHAYLFILKKNIFKALS